MSIEIKFFGQLIEITKSSSKILNDVSDTEGMLKKLYEEYPQLQTAKFSIAVNNKIVQQSTLVEPGTVIALMPPFSGG